MYNLSFHPKALEQLQKLPPNLQERILNKLNFYRSLANPLAYSRKMEGSEESYRFRIGDYRTIFYLEQKSIIVIIVAHRKDVYKNL